MKKIAVIFFMLVYIHVYATPVNVIISGTILGRTTDTLNIRSLNGKLNKDILIDASGKFYAAFETEKGYHQVTLGKQKTEIFIDEGYIIQINSHNSKYDFTVIYEGLGAEINKYMEEKAFINQELLLLEYYGNYAYLDEASFLKQRDSIYNLRVNLLKSYNINNTFFTFIEEQRAYLRKIADIHSYPNMRIGIAKDTAYIKSDNYPDYRTLFDINDVRLLDVDLFIYLLEVVIWDITSERIAKQTDTIDYYLEVLHDINKEIKLPEIKEPLLFTFAFNRMAYTKDKELFVKTYKKYANDKDNIKKVDELHARYKRIDKGAIAPDFAFYDIDSNLVTLKSLRGKVVLIDIWATWCLPCMQELPYTDSLITAFSAENFQFVGICYFDKYRTWIRTVTDWNMKGIHLFAPDTENIFFKQIMMQGIPRYIIIDKDGAFYNSNAKRPSDPRLKAELITLLKAQ